MDNSDSNRNIENGPNDDAAGGARIRTQSECSLASDDGNASKTEKR